jgi:hypothetical protein
MSMEESQRQRDVKEATRVARTLLRASCEPEVGRFLDEGIKKLSPVLTKLITAVERLSDTDQWQPGIVFNPDRFTEAEQVILSSEPEFTISFPSITLSVSEIWPDNDGPIEPTPTEIIARMRDYGGVGSVISDWCLLDSLSVNDVEWHGD